VSGDLNFLFFPLCLKAIPRVEGWSKKYPLWEKVLDPGPHNSNADPHLSTITNVT